MRIQSVARWILLDELAASRIANWRQNDQLAVCSSVTARATAISSVVEVGDGCVGAFAYRVKKIPAAPAPPMYERVIAVDPPLAVILITPEA